MCCVIVEEKSEVTNIAICHLEKSAVHTALGPIHSRSMALLGIKGPSFSGCISTTLTSVSLPFRKIFRKFPYEILQLMNSKYNRSSFWKWWRSSYSRCSWFGSCPENTLPPHTSPSCCYLNFLTLCLLAAVLGHSLVGATSGHSISGQCAFFFPFCFSTICKLPTSYFP